MAETWYKEYCPECNTINWICNGDTTDGDLSKIDVEGYKCRQCKHIWYFGGQKMFEEDKEIFDWESIEDINWELGLENPR